MKKSQKQAWCATSSLRMTPDIQSIYECTKRIRRGRVSTYGDIAGAAGMPRKFRWVGFVLSRNHDPKVPCHRVIQASGMLGGYNGGPLRKAAILQKEGVVIQNDKIDLARFGEGLDRLRKRFARR